MKKLLLLAFVCAAFVGQAQKSGAIKTNPIGMAIGIANLSYETALNEGTSLQFGASYFNLSFGETSFSGVGLGAQYRLYSNDALDGFYYGPLANYFSFTVKDSGNKGTLNGFGAGGQLGWNWLLGSSDNFVIDLGLGVMYNTASVNVEEGNDSFDTGVFDGVGPVLNFSIGYAW